MSSDTPAPPTAATGATVSQPVSPFAQLNKRVDTLEAAIGAAKAELDGMSADRKAAENATLAPRKPMSPDEAEAASLTLLDENFKHHPPSTPEVIAKHESVRKTLRAAAQDLLKIIPPCRERSIVLTNIEQAMFWGNAGIARNCNKTVDESAG